MSTQITDAPRAPRNGTSHGSGDDPGRLVGSRPLPTRARRPGLIGAAIALIVGFALTGALLVSSAGGKTEVLVAAHAVPAGHVLTGEDLRATGVAGDVRAIAATDLSTVVGRTSAVDLAAGQLLNRDMLTDIPVPGAGQALVGLALAPGRFPADGLQPGDQVQAIEVPTAAGAGADLGSPRLLALGEVYALRADGT
ncbi:SAF domain-containing protein, partial [Sporichthya polymorpha]|uniref:SAF domain-containing protein n=1 Tax=Sporichthya polymorpha TaxID=35751 RepID=UPI0003747CC4